MIDDEAKEAMTEDMNNQVTTNDSTPENMLSEKRNIHNFAFYRDFIKKQVEVSWRYFFESIRHKYICFSGRANREEYWRVMLYFILFYKILSFVKFGLGYLFVIALFLPIAGLFVRRAHDIGYSYKYALERGGLSVLAWGIFKIIFFMMHMFSFVDNSFMVCITFLVLLCAIAGGVWALWPLFTIKGEEKENEYGEPVC